MGSNFQKIFGKKEIATERNHFMIHTKEVLLVSSIIIDIRCTRLYLLNSLKKFLVLCFK